MIYMIPQNPQRKKNSAYVEIPRKNDNHAFNMATKTSKCVNIYTHPASQKC